MKKLKPLTNLLSLLLTAALTLSTPLTIFAAEPVDNNTPLYQGGPITILDPGTADSLIATGDTPISSNITYPKDEEEIYERIQALQSKYPYGSEWGWKDEYFSCYVIHNNQKTICEGTKECGAFALTMQEEVFGNAPKYLTYYNENHRPTYNDLHVGDYVASYSEGFCGDPKLGHARLLVKKTPTRLTWVAGNEATISEDLKTHIARSVRWDEHHDELLKKLDEKWGREFSGDTNPWRDTEAVLNNVDSIISCYPPRYFTCSFNSAGGSYVEPITSDLYGYITLPTPPTRKNYTFVEWADDKMRRYYPPETDQIEIHRDTLLRAVWAWSDNNPVTPENAQQITVNTDKCYLTPSANEIITATVTPSNANVEFTWTVNNDVITYEKNDPSTKSNQSSITVTALKPGTATIEVTAKDLIYDVTLHKTVTVVVYDSKEVACYAGEKFSVNDRYFDGQYPADKYTYYVNGPKGTSIKNGILTANKPGKISLKVQIMSTGKTVDELNITVLPKPVLRFTKPMTYKDQTVDIYDCLKINGLNFSEALKQAGASGDNLKFIQVTSSKPSVASVSKEGVITALSSGTTSITAYISEKGRNGAQKKVVIKSSLRVKVPAFGKTSYTMKTGPNPVKIAMKNVTAVSGAAYSSSDPDLMTAEAEVKNGKPTGKALIKVINADPDGKPVTLSANIDGQTYTVPVYITKPTINTSSKNLKTGQTFKVSLKNTGYKGTAIKWTSEDPSVASVDAKGKVTALKTGTTTVYTDTGGVRNKCVITVIE